MDFLFTDDQGNATTYSSTDPEGLRGSGLADIALTNAGTSIDLRISPRSTAQTLLRVTKGTVVLKPSTAQLKAAAVTIPNLSAAANPTSATVTVPANTDLSSLVLANLTGGTFSGLYMGGSRAASFYHLTVSGTGANAVTTVQVQCLDSTDLKCHKLQFTLSGTTLTITRLYTRYRLNSNTTHLGTNFDTDASVQPQLEPSAYTLSGVQVALPYTVGSTGQALFQVGAQGLLDTRQLSYAEQMLVAARTTITAAGGQVRRAMMVKDDADAVMEFDGSDTTTLFTDTAFTTLSAAVGDVINGWKNRIGSFHAVAGGGAPSRQGDGSVRMVSNSFFDLLNATYPINGGYAFASVLANSFRRGAGGAIFTSTFLGGGAGIHINIGGGSASSASPAANRYDGTYWGTDATFPTPTSWAARNIISSRFDGTQRTSSINGVDGSPVSDTRVIANTNNRYRIGRRWDVLECWDGDYFAVVLGTNHAKQVLYDGILAWKHGLQSSLPATHPYRNSAPWGTVTQAGFTPGN